MRASLRLTVAALLGVFCLLQPAAAKQNEEGLPRTQHPWGQFKVGSWKRVRTQTEQLDNKQNVVSSTTTETTTKLVEVDDNGYALRVDVVVEVAGKRFAATPQILRRGFNGEVDGQKVSVKTAADSSLEINGKKILCQVRQIIVDVGETKRVTTVHYTSQLSPFVLKRESTMIDATGKPADFQSQVDVVALGMPCKVGAEIKSASHVRIMNQQGKNATLTIEVHCPDIPGSVVSHTCKETDEQGRIVRRSTLEMLDYGLGTDDDVKTIATRVYPRQRGRRANR